MPGTAVLFAAGMLAIIGLPPFGLFISEFALFRAGFAAGRPWLMGATLVLLTVAFVALVGHLHRMLYGSPAPLAETGERQRLGLVPLGGALAILVVLGLTLPAPVETLLARTVEIIGR
jgi:hydrogenase-4 component F